jgi:hypothetical protein
MEPNWDKETQQTKHHMEQMSWNQCGENTYKWWRVARSRYMEKKSVMSVHWGKLYMYRNIPKIKKIIILYYCTLTDNDIYAFA